MVKFKPESDNFPVFYFFSFAINPRAFFGILPNIFFKNFLADILPNILGEIIDVKIKKGEDLMENGRWKIRTILFCLDCRRVLNQSVRKSKIKLIQK